MGEPFTTTITVVFIFALIFSLPVILFELYGFVLPALNPNERRAVRPLLMAVPFLFAAGVAFGYFIVMPAAVRFLQNFNSGQFNVLVQANQYYQFAATVMLAMGLVFQVPVVIVGATRAGLVTPRQLRRGRRFALVACAAVAAFLPGDAITLLLETAPLYVLYEASILVASFVACRDATRERAGRRRGTRRSSDEAPGVPRRRPGRPRGHRRDRDETRPRRERDNRPHRQKAVRLMLFDLRGRGRRRTVQVIYLGLALIFLLGFVGFGVGVGGGGGGLINALTENNGSSSASFAGKVAAAEKRMVANRRARRRGRH